MFLKNGWAYVPSREQSSIVFQEFQTRLERALEVMHTSAHTEAMNVSRAECVIDDSEGAPTNGRGHPAGTDPG